MHRFILTTALAVLLAVPASTTAQTAIGVRGGIRSATLATGQTTRAITEPVYGGFIAFRLFPRVALQTELVYGTRGAAGLGLGADVLDASAGPVQVQARYLEAPILLRAGLPGERFLASVFAGPYAGFLLSCEVNPEGGSAVPCNDENATQRFKPRATDFGIAVGAGLDLAFGETTVFVDARYTLGLMSLQAGSDGFDARHSALTITGGLAAPLGW